MSQIVAQAERDLSQASAQRTNTQEEDPDVHRRILGQKEDQDPDVHITSCHH